MLSRQSCDLLIDLLENKLSMIYVQDKDDLRVVRKLKMCRQELLDMKNSLLLARLGSNKLRSNIGQHSTRTIIRWEKDNV